MKWILIIILNSPEGYFMGKETYEAYDRPQCIQMLKAEKRLNVDKLCVPQEHYYGQENLNIPLD